MRGLAMALLAFDVPGFGGERLAGSIGMFRSFTSTKTISKKTTAKTV